MKRRKRSDFCLPYFLSNPRVFINAYFSTQRLYVAAFTDPAVESQAFSCHYMKYIPYVFLPATLVKLHSFSHLELQATLEQRIIVNTAF